MVGNGRKNNGARAFASFQHLSFLCTVWSRVGSCFVCLFVCVFVWPVARTSAKGVALSVQVAFFGGGYKNLMRFDGKIKSSRAKRGRSQCWKRHSQC